MAHPEPNGEATDSEQDGRDMAFIWFSRKSDQDLRALELAADLTENTGILVVPMQAEGVARPQLSIGIEMADGLSEIEALVERYKEIAHQRQVS